VPPLAEIGGGQALPTPKKIFHQRVLAFRPIVFIDEPCEKKNYTAYWWNAI
jgi:hypothetical protein